ncbi:lytic transglycosylase domain-containing protein [Magnetospirillum sp. 15-1]|uniref:lytic transglycosylase domain-containing protein n=1 Tax=Magnetospirillum sp. 15-1 TaxID=1979370 RepID=UPI000BBC7003|nr:lytic transglycosylase domain-containing protein [Magnetospirillum sp. 15-1]
MDRLSLLVAGLLAVMPAQAADRWQPAITEAAQRFVLPESWIRAVLKAESGGNPRAVSPKGAMGLMQIMPGTWAELRLHLGLGPDPFDPRDNILAGAAYLRAMHDRYGSPGLFAAYNAGPARYDRYLRSGTPLPAETRRYLATLARAPTDATLPPALRSGTRLFFHLRTVENAPLDDPKAAGSGDLFVPLTTGPGEGK